MIHRKIEGIWTSEIGDDFLIFQLFQVAAACELLPGFLRIFFSGSSSPWPTVKHQGICEALFLMSGVSTPRQLQLFLKL